MNFDLLDDRFRIEETDPSEQVGIDMVERLWYETNEIYGESPTPCRFRPAEVKGPGCVFLVAWCGEDAAACGAIRKFAGAEGEVKRIYVKPEFRNQGLAERVMRALHQRALEMGYTSLRLETGSLQPYAIRLYERLGYRLIEPYGDYADHPLARCFAVDLSPLDRTTDTNSHCDQN